MYLIISVNPKTWNTETKKLTSDFKHAIDCLNSEATNFVKVYRNYEQPIRINSKNEIDNHPETKFFIKSSNKQVNRKINIYERRKGQDKGWLYNSDVIDKIHMLLVIDYHNGMNMRLGNNGMNMTSDKNGMNIRSGTSNKDNPRPSPTNNINISWIDELKNVLEQKYGVVN